MKSLISKRLSLLGDELRSEVTDNILPFWIEKAIDNLSGGFVGQITCDDVKVFDAPKGAVLNARILWTFAAAYRIFRNDKYLEIATRAKDYLLKRFVDTKYGGVFWALDAHGKPLDTKKQIYALGFAIYGLSEYYRVTRDEEVLKAAVDLFGQIEKHAYDPANGGYFEAFKQDWTEIGDMRLSAKDFNESKTMNTHLHIIEPYVNLFRVWKDPLLESRIRELIDVFLGRIIDTKTGHLNLFFSEKWDVKSNIVSYGHDIEASWLIHEAALVLGDSDLLAKTEPCIRKIADAAAEGLQPDGSIIYEYDKTIEHYDMDRHWWPQAEAVVGYFNIFQYFSDPIALDRVVAGWHYIKKHLIDPQYGEWFWSIKADGSVDTVNDKAGFWKCPYHNSRMCFEIIERLHQIKETV